MMRPSSRPTRGRFAPPSPEDRSALAALLLPTAWPVDAAFVAASVERNRARWEASGIDPLVRAIAGLLPAPGQTLLDRCRFDRIDPALAAFLAKRAVVPTYALQLDRAAKDLIALGRSWSADAHPNDAALAYGAAITALYTCGAASDYAGPLLVAAQDLPPACRGLAEVADTRGNSQWAQELRAAADRWDRLYAAWRRSIAGPPSLLPNTGAAASHPAEHRAALISLAQLGVTAASFAVYAVILAATILVGLAAILLRRSAVPVHWATPASGWLLAGVVLLAPTIVAWALLSLAGDDWSWLFSTRVVLAIVLLVILAHATTLSLVARFLVRRENEARTRRADWIIAGFRVLPLLLATLGAFSFVLEQPDRRPDMVPPLIEFPIALSWAWLATTAAFLGIGWTRRLVHRTRRPARSPAGFPTPEPRDETRATHNPLLALAALGLFVHAALLPSILWRNDHVFRAHSQKVAYTLTDEPAFRLGPDWRTTRLPAVTQLLASLREPR